MTRALALIAAIGLLAGCAGGPEPTSGDASPTGDVSSDDQPVTAPRSSSGQDPSADDGAGTSPSTGGGIPGVPGPDGLDELTDEQRAALEERGSVVLAARQVDGGVIAVSASTDGEGIDAAFVAEPRELLDTSGFGGSGELLVPGDSCNFRSLDAGWTLVITGEPTAVVSLELADGTRIEQLARPTDVAGTPIGLVFVEGSLAEDGPRPTADPGGPC